MAYKISEDCAACGTCIDECPVGAISGTPGKNGTPFVIDQNKCIKCGLCESACKFKAIIKK